MQKFSAQIPKAFFQHENAEKKKIYNGINQLYQIIMQEKFKIKENGYNSQKNTMFQSRPFGTAKYGFKSWPT